MKSRKRSSEKGETKARICIEPIPWDMTEEEWAKYKEHIYGDEFKESE